MAAGTDEGTDPIDETVAGTADPTATVGPALGVTSGATAGGADLIGVVSGVPTDRSGTAEGTAADGVPGVTEGRGRGAAPAGWARAVRMASPMITPANPAKRMPTIRPRRRTGVRAVASPATVCPIVSTAEEYHSK
jgi:hypothetical protein